MAVEKYIHGKHDNGKHVGRASNARAEAEAYGEQQLAEDLMISMQMVKVLSPGTELYEFHKGRIAFWMDRVGKNGGLTNGE